MKHLKPTLRILIIVLLSTTSCQFNSQQTPSPNEVSIDLQEDIDQLIALYNVQEMPEYLWERNPALTGNEFDINEIFGILDHIHTVGGYELAYVYQTSDFGPRSPLIYAKQTGNQPFLSLTDYEAAQSECVYNNPPSYCDYLTFIQADGSDIGYLQMVLIKIMGNLFYPALGDQQVLIATKDSLNKIITKWANNEFGVKLDEDAQKRALAIDPTPKLTKTDSALEIRVIYFTVWEGFLKPITR